MWRQKLNLPDIYSKHEVNTYFYYPTYRASTDVWPPWSCCVKDPMSQRPLSVLADPYQATDYKHLCVQGLDLTFRPDFPGSTMWNAPNPRRSLYKNV